MSNKLRNENAKIKDWFDENIRDDVEDNIMIAQIAIRDVSKNFNLAFGSEATLLATYGVIYASIMEVLMEQRKEYSSFDINVAGRFEIGYSDAEENDDAEKMGSFVPHIFDLNSGKKTYEETSNKTTIQIATEWMSKNVTANREIINKISTVALKNLKDQLDLNFNEAVVCIPIFINIHECMISYLKLKQVERNEYETMITFASCFDVYIRMNEEREQTVEYASSISDKLLTKSDALATAKHE